MASLRAPLQAAKALNVSLPRYYQSFLLDGNDCISTPASLRLGERAWVEDEETLSSKLDPSTSPVTDSPNSFVFSNRLRVFRWIPMP